LKKKVCFSIVSHGQSSLTNLLLTDIDKNIILQDFDFEVLVTDNINEKCWKPLLHNFKLRKISNLRKKGFGANHNAAYEISEPDFFFVINPDVRIEETINLDTFINQMVDMNVYAPKIVNEFGTLGDYKRKKITFLNLIRRRLSMQEAGNYTWFSGIFQGYTRNTFNRLKGFDTRYFMYVEDADICHRLITMGGHIKEVSHVTVKHHAQRQSLKQLKHFRWHLNSLAIFFLKKAGLFSDDL
jgi:N-acetylglucosaminyl-diphospho-decaprenol L-rhamnosyltransferase